MRVSEEKLSEREMRGEDTKEPVLSEEVTVIEVKSASPAVALRMDAASEWREKWMLESVKSPSVFETDVCVAEDSERINKTSDESTGDERSPTDLIGREEEGFPVTVIMSAEGMIMFVVSMIKCVPICSVIELNRLFLSVNA